MIRNPRCPPLILLACFLGASPLGAEEEAPDAVKKALQVLAQAVTKPPSNEEDAERARAAILTLAKHKHGGIAKIAWKLATDERQSDRVRGGALLALRDSHDSPADKVRELTVAMVRDRKQTRGLRASAAFVLGTPRFSDADARIVLNRVLLRPSDDGIVQRTCLSALVATEKLSTIRKLLLRRELYEHDYFGIRVDVCSGLAALNVRDRRALEILCMLLVDNDDKDWTRLVPQEAWLTLWSLSGRAHGVDPKDRFAGRPSFPQTDKMIRQSFRNISLMRAGVDRSMVACVKALTHLEPNSRAKKGPDGKWVAPELNTKALKAAAEAFRRDFDQIVREWPVEKAR